MLGMVVGISGIVVGIVRCPLQCMKPSANDISMVASALIKMFYGAYVNKFEDLRRMQGHPCIGCEIY